MSPEQTALDADRAPLTIALAQIVTDDVPRERAVQGMLEWIDRAAHASADLIVFPELVLQGGREPTVAVSNEELTRITDAVGERLRRHAMDAVLGSVVAITSDGHTVNRSLHLSRNGKVVAHHDKVRLWTSERDRMEPGRSVTVSSVAGWHLGILVCWDITDPELSQALARAGTDVVVVPAYWPTQYAGPEIRHDALSESRHIDALCQARAMENGVAVAFCNAAGDAPARAGHRRHLVGRSQVVVPFQGAIARAQGWSEEMIVAQVDAGLLADARALYGLPSAPLDLAVATAAGR